MHKKTEPNLEDSALFFVPVRMQLLQSSKGRSGALEVEGVEAGEGEVIVALGLEIVGDELEIVVHLFEIFMEADLSVGVGFLQQKVVAQTGEGCVITFDGIAHGGGLTEEAFG